MPNLVELIKQISNEAQRAEQPTDVLFGTVQTTSPLSIMIDQKTTLTSEFIVVPQYLTRHQISMSFNGTTGKGGDDDHTHNVNYSGVVTINNQLKTGDRVIMIKQAGGQTFVILDKIGG